MILAAGLGTRLKPWTEHHPKALVPVGGVPMLGRVIRRLVSEGFDDIVVNVHHFPDQIKEYLESGEFEDVEIEISDESDLLLDTGGGLVNAADKLFRDSEAALVHNVDILSTAPLRELMESHIVSGAGATLLVSGRESSRKLVFSGDMSLEGWHGIADGSYRPEGYLPSENSREFAFSGIYAVSRSAVDEMAGMYGKGTPFPIMDYFLSRDRTVRIRGEYRSGLDLIDIGKPATLSQANNMFG